MGLILAPPAIVAANHLTRRTPPPHLFGSTSLA